jgi:Family of unknown function (DUF6111)
MIRLFTQEFLLFLIPSFCFTIFLLLNQRDPRHKVHWNGKGIALFLAGLLLAASSFVYEGVVAPRDTGTYVPAHTENGILVPGHFR